MLEIIWTLACETDAQSFYVRFEAHTIGLGDRYFAELQTTAQLLSAYPRSCRVVHPAGLRRALFFQRMLGLIYRAEARGVVMHAVLQLRDDPDFIQRRLSEIAAGLPTSSP